MLLLRIPNCIFWVPVDSSMCSKASGISNPMPSWNYVLLAGAKQV